MTSQPYQPGWVDRFWDRVDRLPFPAWVFYLGMYLLGVVLVHAGRWINGEVAVGTLDLESASQAMWFALPFAWMHYLERLAARALPQFDPVVPEGRRDEYGMVRFRMLAMPARTTHVVVTIPMLIAAGAVVAEPFFTGGSADAVVASLILAGLIAVAFGTLPLLLFFNVRMLRLVTAAYRLVDDVPVIDQRPLFSLSNLTMQVGLSWVLVVNVNLLSTLLLEGGFETGFDIALVAGFSVTGMLLAFVLFLLPLRGIHKKLADAKNGLITENALALDRTRLKLYAALDTNAHDEVDRFDRAISSLLRIRDELRTIPTWPWRHGTLRGFSSVVITPMVLWGAQQALARWL